LGGWDQIFTERIGAGTPARQLTIDLNQHSYPVIDGDRVAWSASDGFHYQIFTQDVVHDLGATPLTGDFHDHGYPAVSGNRVAWVGSDGANYQIFTQRVGTDFSPTQLTSDANMHQFPKVYGDRVTWAGVSGGFMQVFTMNVGTDAGPLQLTTDPHPHDSPQISGTRVVWDGYDGSHYQIFRSKPVTTPSVVRTPSSAAPTFKRKKGVARVVLAATLRDTDGTLVGGARAYLQTSSNGKNHWKNAYKLATNTAGTASVTIKVKKAKRIYARWYVPAAAGYNSVTTKTQRIRVK
jgi:hypothetical protein